MTAPLLARRRKTRQGPARVFAIPAVLFLATIAGLALGLAGEGLPDWSSWLLLSLPILAAARACLKRS